MERVARVVEGRSLSIQALVVARSAVILRGIRGALGIPWAAGLLVEDEKIFNKLARPHPAALGKLAHTLAESRSMRLLGKSLLQAHAKKEHTSKTWAAHREKRHAGMSGHQFLRALATEDGSKGAARMLIRLVRFTRRWMLQGGASSWTDMDTAELFQVAHGAMPLRRKRRGNVFGADYTAVSAGLGFMLWAMSSDRMPVVIFGEESFQLILKGQSTASKTHMVSAGART